MENGNKIMENFENKKLDELEIELEKLNHTYESYVKNGLMDKARAKLAIIDKLSDEIYYRKFDNNS
jgi:DNA-directed RNA polymerase subunit L